jgi:hypothetical protein
MFAGKGMYIFGPEKLKVVVVVIGERERKS